MKRIIIAIILLISLVICLPSCNGVKENPEFAKFNEMFDTTFENYKITISTSSKNGMSVTNEYVVTTLNGQRQVSYKTETLNQFIVNGNSIEIPESYVTVEQGTYDATTSASSSFDVPKFNFSYKCIKSDIMISNTFSADITSLNDFMGLDVNSTDAEFTVLYSEKSPESIEISYVTDEDVTIVILYSFN